MVVVAGRYHHTRTAITAQPSCVATRGPALLVFGCAISVRVPVWFYVNGASNGVVVHCGNLTYLK